MNAYQSVAFSGVCAALGGAEPGTDGTQRAHFSSTHRSRRNTSCPDVCKLFTEHFPDDQQCAASDGTGSGTELTHVDKTDQESKWAV